MSLSLLLAPSICLAVQKCLVTQKKKNTDTLMNTPFHRMNHMSVFEGNNDHLSVLSQKIAVDINETDQYVQHRYKYMVSFETNLLKKNRMGDWFFFVILYFFCTALCQFQPKFSP